MNRAATVAPIFGILILALKLGCGSDDSAPPAAGGQGGAGVSDGAGAGASGGSSSVGGGGASGADASGGASSGSGGASAGASAEPGEGGNAGEGGGGVEAACPTASEPVVMGELADDAIAEASGLAPSHSNDGIWYVHNDSGSEPRAYALDETGALVTTLVFDGASGVDWEDMEVGPGPSAGGSYLYFADIGDNGLERDSVVVIRAMEPVIDADAAPDELEVDFETLELEYPDGPHNAETFLLDPETQDLFIVTKGDAAGSEVFVARAPHATETINTLEHVATLPFGGALLPGDTLATSGDISADGRQILLRTYDSAFWWSRPVGTSIEEALDSAPCPMPLAEEEQGEAIAFSPDGESYVTLSEGEGAELFRVTFSK